MDSPAIVQWLDQRLNDGSSSVECSRITPRFQVVGGRDVPAARCGSFIAIESPMHARSRFGQCSCEFEVGCQVVGRIAVQYEKELNLSCREVLNQPVDGWKTLMIRFTNFVNEG